MIIGAQLYTLREHAKNLGDLSDSLKKVSDIGFTSVQISGTCFFEPQWMADQLIQNGLTCMVTHTAPDLITENTLEVAENHKIFGANIVGIGSAPGGFAGGFSDYDSFRDRFLPAAVNLKAQGLRFGYHNHHFEFQKYDGEVLLERIFKDFKSENIAIILDTYWTQFSGANPSDWIRKFKGHVPSIHVKDLAIVKSEQRYAPVGDGNISWESVISACEDAETEQILVEQDDCYGENPFECLARSYQYLRSLGL